MVHKTVVLDVVGLTRDLISRGHTPFLAEYLAQSSSVDVEPAFPALTCTAQATYVTGLGPKQHGIAGNGWYDRDYCEVKNWHQSAKLVQAPRVWDQLKEEHPDATVFVNGWWHGMHDTNVDYFINVRPQYLQNGGKKPDVYTRPSPLRDQLQGELGLFPLHRFWGPGAGIEGSKWIADASMIVDKAHDPTLTLVYLPHLDYSLQKYGPDDKEHVPGDLAQIDSLLRTLVEYYEGERGARVIILSEYGIEPVTTPVYLNRVLRAAGHLELRTECGGETLDYGASEAFALCDHQVAHVYLQPGQDPEPIKKLLADTAGVESVHAPAELDAAYRQQGHGSGAAHGAHHAERTGDLVCIAQPGSWFAYYYWEDGNDAMAPDFARCVAIHKKPGYDPAEMFFRYPAPFGFLYLLWKLFLVYLLQLRLIVDATPLTCDNIRGSHGRFPDDPKYKPVLIARRPIRPNSAEAPRKHAGTRSGGGGGGGGGGAVPAEDVYAHIYDNLVSSD